MVIQILALLMLYMAPANEQEPIDLILYNGNIITVDEKVPKVEAIAINDGKIVGRGNNQAIKLLASKSTKLIDLSGKTAIPGFIEGHGHLQHLGQTLQSLQLGNAKNWDEIVEAVAATAKKTKPGDWIIGFGWHQEKWNKVPNNAINGYPQHHDLSDVSPNNPVFLSHASGHASFVNAKAMELAGISKDTQAPDGGKILRDANGNATGVFNETASQLMYKAIGQWQSQKSPERIKAETKEQIRLAVEECLAKGVTSFQDAGSSFQMMNLFKEMAENGELNMRLWAMVREPNPVLKGMLPKYAKMKGLGNGFFTLGGIKKSIDGALGSRGAWLLEPYSDLPSSSGLILVPPDQLEEAAAMAKEYNLQMCTHAIGDRGNRETLDVYEKLLGGKNLRWRIEHAQHLHPEDIPRFAKLNVIASMQGIHCTSDAPYVEKRLGQQRARDGAYVWRKLIDSGALICNGTDAPIEDVSPIASYYATVTRNYAEGKSFYPDQKLNRMEALKTYTINAAYAASEDHLKGSLSVGKYADITVLSKDITAIPAQEILKTKVTMTLVNGRIVYQP